MKKPLIFFLLLGIFVSENGTTGEGNMENFDCFGFPNPISRHTEFYEVTAGISQGIVERTVKVFFSFVGSRVIARDGMDDLMMCVDIWF